MSNSLSRRVDKLEAALGAGAAEGVAVVERDRDGRLRSVALRFAYRFGEAGEIIGIKVGDQIYSRHPGETVSALRRRAMERLDIMVQFWRGFIDQVSGHSRGLPFKNQDISTLERWRREDAKSKARIAADAVRRKDEGEWGVREIGFLELHTTDD
jgi:hypothetical protein